MAQTPEARVKAKVKVYLDGIKAWYFMPSMTGFGRSGIPDFIVCWRGLFFGIETKAPGKSRNTTVMQDREIEGINLAGGRAVVVDDVSQLANLFDDSQAMMRILQ